jgi:hypothetical protein
LLFTDGRTEEQRVAAEVLGEPCRSAIERVARRAGEGVLTTRRGEEGIVSVVGERVERVRTVASMGDIFGDAREGEREGGRGNRAEEMGREVEESSTEDATLRRERVEGALRMIPGLRRREEPEGCFERRTEVGPDEVVGGTGRGRALRMGGGNISP